MKIINKYGLIFASVYYDPVESHLFNCNVEPSLRDITRTYHYIALAGVELKKGFEGEDLYWALIHNSWGGVDYHRVRIHDIYIDCNTANALFVLEPTL